MIDYFEQVLLSVVSWFRDVASFNSILFYLHPTVSGSKKDQTKPIVSLIMFALDRYIQERMHFLGGKSMLDLIDLLILGRKLGR